MKLTKNWQMYDKKLIFESSAKGCIVLKLCRARRELSKAHLIAKFGFDGWMDGSLPVVISMWPWAYWRAGPGFLRELFQSPQPQLCGLYSLISFQICKSDRTFDLSIAKCTITHLIVTTSASLEDGNAWSMLHELSIVDNLLTLSA